MLDFVKNHNPVSVYRALAVYQERGETPDFLEGFEFPDDDGLRKYASTAFADPDTRSFPILDKAHTLLSAICYYGDGGNNPETEREILKAASAQGIVEYVKEAALFAPGIVKKASVGNDYALVLDDGDKQVGYLPIDDEGHLGSSARGLEEAIRKNSLPLMKAAEAAQAIVKKARELDIPWTTLPETILKFSTDRLPDEQELNIQLALRKKLADPEAGEVYEEIFKTAAYNDANIPDCIELIEDMDRLNLDLEKYAYTGIKNAWETMNSGIPVFAFEKLASDFITITVDDESVTLPLQAIEYIPEEMIKVSFRKETGETIFDALKKNDSHEAGALLNSLGTDAKASLLGLAAKYAGEYVPVYKA